MHNPVPSVLPFEEGSNIAQGPGGVKSLVRSPLVVAGTDTNAWEDYNYKSFPGRLLVVICTEVDRGSCKDTPSRTENQNALPAVLRPRRRLDFSFASNSTRGDLGAIPTPVPLSHPL